jgi:Lrp/AsnC family transcriptional regulator for asnA, asnC and gidA
MAKLLRKSYVRNHVIDLDFTDLAIIRALLPNSRKSVTVVASEIGVSESTVRNRLKKFAMNKVMDFELTTDPMRFGYSVWAMLEINVELPKIREVADLISREPRIHMVGITSGAYDIFAATVLRSNQDLVELITNRLSKIPGITRVSSSTILEMVKRRTNFGFPEKVYEPNDSVFRKEVSTGIQVRRSS